MKKVTRIGAFILVVCMLSMLFAACGANPAKPYLGKWNAYKVAGDGVEIVFADYASIVKMEMTVEFTEEGTYVFHYYVNGEEGDKYPQRGTYEIDQSGKLVMNDKGGYAEIVNGELIVTFDNGGVKQYYRPAN